MRPILICLALLFSSPLVAQQAGVFTSYEELRQELDASIMDVDMTRLYKRFGGRQYTDDQIAKVQSQVSNVFRQKPVDHIIVRRQILEGGLRQEISAYWNGTVYLYVFVRIHERSDGVLALKFALNTDFDKLNTRF